MQILKADFLLTCKENFEIIQNGAICFEKEIIDLDSYENIKKRYPNISVTDLGANSVILPGLINPHVHLEFSANKTTLQYGDFISWLGSVIKHRDEITTKGKEEIASALKSILKSGTTSIGAISSFGGELQECVSSKLRVVYFNEILGSRPDTVDILFEDFKSRLHRSEDLANELFIPAISVHSPYSTHPILAKNALDIAKKRDYVVSTHFMESQAERDWLDSAKGDFQEFFSSFIPNAKPLCNSFEYIELFKENKTLFTHCTKASKEEIEKIISQNGYITHCPVSNRLLGNGRLNIEEIEEKSLTLGTDGLSSNNSLNLWDEMRMAMMMHFEADLKELSKTLLQASTINSAKALNLNSGSLEIGKNADIITLRLPDLTLKEDVATQLILHTKEAKDIYINGKSV